MAGPVVVIVGCIAAAAGVPLLWLAWNRLPPEKFLPRSGGWLLILGGALLLGLMSGAWGYATAATATSVAALLVLGVIALRAPPAKRVATRAALLHPLDARRIITELPRRIGVFLLVVPGGLLSSTILALGARTAAKHLGWPEADSTMLALGGMPLVWSIIASLQMTQTSLPIMAALAAVPAIVGGLLGLVA